MEPTIETKTIRIDILINAKSDESGMLRIDEDGDAIKAIEGLELMGDSDVRILIKPGIPAGRVRNVLKKIARQIKRRGIPTFEPPRVIDDPFAQ